MKNVKIKWKKEPEEHDYPAAKSYLLLVTDEIQATRVVGKLKDAEMTAFKAKDIFRSSQLSLLGVSNSHVKKNIKKIKKGKDMVPILLVRGNSGRVIIADGYHRLCAVYTIDEDALIPCKIV